MNFQFYLEKLFVSKEFENFKKEKPEAYFFSGFFVIEGDKANKVHIDYFNPETRKMFSFQLESDCQVVPIEQVCEENPVKILDNVDFNFEEIRKMIVDRASSDLIKNKAIQAGMKTLRDDGLDKVLKGITTAEEVIKATQEK